MVFTHESPTAPSYLLDPGSGSFRFLSRFHSHTFTDIPLVKCEPKLTLRGTHAPGLVSIWLRRFLPPLHIMSLSNAPKRAWGTMRSRVTPHTARESSSQPFVARSARYASMMMSKSHIKCVHCVCSGRTAKKYCALQVRFSQ